MSLKKIISALMIAVMLSQAFSAFASDGVIEQKTVTIAYYEAENMMRGAWDGAKKGGYAYDYMQEVKNNTGWNYEYVYGTFPELMERFLNGEIDVFPYLSYSDERAEKMLYPNIAMGVEEFYLSTLPGKEIDCTDLTNLNGKRIGVDKDTFQVIVLREYLKEHGISAVIVPYETTEMKWVALHKGEIDVSYDTCVVASTELVSILKIGEQDYFVCVSKNRPDLIEDLNVAQSTISETNRSYIATLHSEYFGNAPLHIMLSSEEEDWLRAHPVVKAGGLKNLKPYSYVTKNGSPAGVNYDILNLAFNKLRREVSVEWVLFDSESELLRALYAGEIDICVPEYRSYYVAEQDGVLISSTMVSINMAMLHKGVTDNTDIETIAVSNNGLARLYVEEYYPSAKLLITESVAAAKRKVQAGDADCVIAQADSLNEETERIFGSKIFTVSALAQTCDVSAAATSENALILKTLNRGLALITVSERDRIVSAHSVESLQNEELINTFLREYYREIMLIAIAVLILVIIIIVASCARRKKAENEYRQSIIEANTKLNQMNRKINESLQLAEEASKAKTSFLFNMSHDIRTPMNAIRGYTAMAKKHVDDPKEVGELLEKIDVSGSHLLSLVNQVLEMSRIESGKVTLQEQLCDVLERSEELITIAQGNAKVKDINLSRTVRRINHRMVLTDGDRVNQVILNIVGNAIKYTAEGGKVEYIIEERPYVVSGKVSETHGLYYFTVKDNGIGMSKEFLTHIFDDFSRENSTTVSKIQGTGLGMSIVKKLVDLMGGTIEIESEKGVGTTMTVALPLKYAEDQTPVGSDEKSDGVIDFSGKRLLLVEDNEMNREIACDVLEDAGFTVETANDGDIAVGMVARSDPGYYDAVLMDVQMPTMNGYEATKAIRALPMKDHAEIVIIAMTANVFEEDRQNAINAGMNDHLKKPIEVTKLFDTLSKYIK
ncbi:MAG: transporter substrate-binding domain-containing protein [Firmicutes bacterium]|nr:transporter substrate-binding domain-containing protein [Candidatus Colimorpha enterica]